MTNFPSDLPGAELVRRGLEDLAARIDSIEALLVSIGAPRLRSCGLEVPSCQAKDPQLALYGLLCGDDDRDAHSRYNALIRRLISFEQALERCL